MSEKYDSSKHEVVGVRVPNDDDMILTKHGNVIRYADHDEYQWNKFPQDIVRLKPEPTHDLAWAVAEMVRNPGKEYIGHYSGYIHRFDIEEWGFQQKDSYVDWGPAVFTELDLGCTEWRAVAEPAAPVSVLSLESLSARLAELEKRQ